MRQLAYECLHVVETMPYSLCVMKVLYNAKTFELLHMLATLIH